MEKDKNTISHNVDLKNILSEGCAYHDDNITMIDRLQNIHAKHLMKTDAYVVVLCLKGKGSFCMDNTPYTINENDLLICHPNVILENAMVSVNFECRGFIFSSQYVQQQNIISNESWNLRMLLEKYPILSLIPREVNAFMQYYDLLRSKLIDPPHKYQEELISAILQAFSYDFYRIQERFTQQVPQNMLCSAEILFKKFINLLSTFSPRERKVKFYADKLFISPKYLSSVCKAQSGYTVSVLINQFVVKDIEFMLKQPDKSIKDIVNEINFPNISFFGKYVRTHFGMSPREYRLKLLGRTTSKISQSEDNEK
ncbi:helix-turn-helix transcriptional regulator [Parabacteroides sp. AM08-6]|uniref:AraC family transcriptional regulator n=1 Tax=Parabacteroides sp. AM08-6 TaxID=2292053 RepID=UPI000F000271|nr:helix-turn-helix transcriptional regulator [Parabacteroides sp. AM08-6]RHJ86758.1 AraC family transcriptional regulator [Parabacteroides sp. AM08-6]